MLASDEGAADCGEYRQVAGAVAKVKVSDGAKPSKRHPAR
jgi:hypothetical protein